MDGFIAGFMVLTILSVFLAFVPIFIIISMILNTYQERTQAMILTVVTQLTEHHDAVMQQVMTNLFDEMKRLSSKIPTVSASPRKQAITESIPNLPIPSPRLLTREDDEGKD